MVQCPVILSCLFQPARVDDFPQQSCVSKDWIETTGLSLPSRNFRCARSALTSNPSVHSTLSPTFSRQPSHEWTTSHSDRAYQEGVTFTVRDQLSASAHLYRSRR